MAFTVKQLLWLNMDRQQPERLDTPCYKTGYMEQGIKPEDSASQVTQTSQLSRLSSKC